MKDYCIKHGYTIRQSNEFFDDTPYTDTWQNEVYEKAREIADANEFKVIYDIGCGSGYKLLKYFKDFVTVGVDLEKTVTWLKEKYPERKWTENITGYPNCDLLICSDVIEHVVDPDMMLSLISMCQPKVIVLSTPDRDLLKNGQDGPPHNLAHVREWSFIEFEKYISQTFKIHEHYIANHEQATQVIVCS
jgi:hypothetical protein